MLDAWARPNYTRVDLVTYLLDLWPVMQLVSSLDTLFTHASRTTAQEEGGCKIEFNPKDGKSTKYPLVSASRIDHPYDCFRLIRTALLAEGDFDQNQS